MRDLNLRKKRPKNVGAIFVIFKSKLSPKWRKLDQSGRPDLGDSFCLDLAPGSEGIGATVCFALLVLDRATRFGGFSPLGHFKIFFFLNCTWALLNIFFSIAHNGNAY
jgi:hypothetical protein